MTPASEAILIALTVPGVALVLKATLVLAAGLLAARLARRAPAAHRHFILACTLGSLAVLPIASLFGPAVPVPVAIDHRPTAASLAIPAPAAGAARAAAVDSRVAASAGPSTPTLDPRTWLPRLWLAGAAFFLLSPIVSLVRARRLARTALPWLDARPLADEVRKSLGVRGDAGIARHEAASGPFLLGAFPPLIVMPLDATAWPAAGLRRVLVHELEHARRGDWLVQHAARIVCALYWFHPLAWRAASALALEAERACDDAVVRDGGREVDYADDLVRLAGRLRDGARSPLLAMAARHHLAVRVTALLDDRQPRGRVGSTAVLAAAGVAAAVVLSLAPVHAVAAGTGAQRVAERAGASHDDSPLGEVLYNAAAKGNQPRVTALLDAGADVNAVVPGDGSPLIGAARNGHLEVVRLLLDRGADVNLAVGGDGNPLIAAAAAGRLEVVDLLLERGASVDAVVPGDENALIQASAHGMLPVVSRLVAAGADVNARVLADAGFGSNAGEWRTPLSQARKHRHTAVVEFLLNAGAR